MKKHSSLLFFCLFTFLLHAQNTGTPFLEIKITPTSIINIKEPSLFVGAEFYLSRKIGLQMEYGIPVAKGHQNILGSISPVQGEADQLFHRFKGEIKYYTFFERGFANYLSAGFNHTPESYTLLTGAIVLLDGQNVFLASPRMESDQTALFIDYGGKIWISKHFFFEYYTGAGVKFTKNRLAKSEDIPPPVGLPVFSRKKNQFIDFNENRFSEGDWMNLFIDFGFKFGISF